MLLFSIKSYSQNSEKIELIYAEKLKNGPVNSNYWLCTGDVLFSHNSTNMNCDYSHHYIKENKMIAFGNIKINRGDTLTVLGNKLIYDGNSNIAHLSGNVLLRDNHTQLSTKEIILDFNKNIAYYPSKGIITENDVKLSSLKGSYNTKSNYFYFKDNVEVVGPNYNVITDTLNYNSKTKTTFFIGPTFIYSNENTIYCENGWYNTLTDLSQFKENAYLTNGEKKIMGDSLFYNRNTGYGKAMNNVIMLDTSSKICANGELAEYFEEEEKIIIQEKTNLNILIEKDTIFINSDKFIYCKKNTKYILAFNNVKTYNQDFQSICDSMYYNISDSTIELFKDPIIWTNDIQISSDSIKISLYKEKIDKMLFYPNPMIVYEADETYFNQIKGKLMEAHFNNGELKKVNIIGNSESLFLIEEENGLDIGFNKAISSDITMKMKSGEIYNLIYKKSPNSITIPIEKIEEENKMLEGFIWKIKEKPVDRKDIIQ